MVFSLVLSTFHAQIRPLKSWQASAPLFTWSTVISSTTKRSKLRVYISNKNELKPQFKLILAIYLAAFILRLSGHTLM